MTQAKAHHVMSNDGVYGGCVHYSGGFKEAVKEGLYVPWWSSNKEQEDESA